MAQYWRTFNRLASNSAEPPILSRVVGDLARDIPILGADCGRRVQKTPRIVLLLEGIQAVVMGGSGAVEALQEVGLVDVGLVEVGAAPGAHVAPGAQLRRQGLAG